MVEYIIGAILLIITVFIVLLIFRKRIYDRVDALETWKIDVMNRNVASELTKLKELNLSGETQEKFEKWKARWEGIIAGELADVEELLYDAEESADRFLFPQANKTLKALTEILEKSDREVDKILDELNGLLQVEKDSKTKLSETTDEVQRLRSLISEQRYDFGRADRYYESKLDKNENELLLYYEYVEAGEYTKAKDHVQEISEEVLTLSEDMDLFPGIYQKCRKELPGELQQLSHGISEMNVDGYRVKPYAYDSEIQQHEETLQKCVSDLEKGELDNVIEMAEEIENRIAEIYENLEEEATAKNYIDSHVKSFIEKTDQLYNLFQGTKEDVERLKVTYFFAEGNMEKLLSLEKQITQLENHTESFMEELEDEEKNHVYLKDKLESQLESSEKLTEDLETFISEMNNLRKDELEARDNLEKMHTRLSEVNRLLHTSNLPGVPNFLWDRMEEAKSSLSKVASALDKQPLDISQAQHALENANKAIEQSEEEAEVVLDQCYFTEQVIQYANRYRSQYPLLSAELSEAERLFRDFEYELALEKAARAIEEIEPGALKKIEENQRYRQSI